MMLLIKAILAVLQRARVAVFTALLSPFGL